MDNKRVWENDVRVNAQRPLCQNYMIGIVHQGSDRVGRGLKHAVGELGVPESLGRFVSPQSLYLAQLEERLGSDAVRGVATTSQLDSSRGVTWRRLSQRYSSLPEWPDPEAAPWPEWKDWVPEFKPTDLRR